MAYSMIVACVRPEGSVRVVDGGRPGLRHLGIPGGGAADHRAQATANQLLERDDRAPCLEFSGAGGRWLLSGRGQFALTGADMNWRLNGRLVETYHVQYLDGDGLLTATPARKGVRAYLAIAGEWQLPQVLGSCEPGLPGLPPVTEGWSAEVVSHREVPFTMHLDVAMHYPPDQLTLHSLTGPEWDHLCSAQQHWLTTGAFRVGSASNRQGVRLTADEQPQRNLPPLLSSPVLPGTVQLTPDGPIVLGPDAQTIGGYPRVLLVREPDDLAACFQLSGGAAVVFRRVPSR